MLIPTAASACASATPIARQRALLLVDKGQTEAAAELLTSHLAEHPEAIAERRLLIRVHALSGQLGRAREQAERLAQQLGPQSPVPWLELGHALELMHRYDEALELYDRASSVAPRDAIGPRTGGLRAARWGQYELAETRLVEALQRNVQDAEVWHALGVVRLQLGKLDGATQAYRSGLMADARAYENRIGLATVAVMRGDAKAALNEYDAILAARPSFADAHLGRAWALMNLGRFDEAAAALELGSRSGASPVVAARQRDALRRLRLEVGRKNRQLD